MQKLTIILGLFISLGSFAQNSSKILEEINKYHQNDYEFKKYDLFSTINDRGLSEKISSSVFNFTLLKMKPSIIKEIYQDKPLLIEISIPYNDDILTIELYKKEILTETFIVTDENGNNQNYKPGVYYRGVIKNSSQSVAALSFFKDRVYGVASSLEQGNINIGKLKGYDEYISFADQDLKGENPFVCGFDDIEENVERVTHQNSNFIGRNQQMTNNCVRVYYEVAYEPYLQNDSSVEETVNWVTSIHNNISTLYDNDDIQIALSEIMVWTDEDPYNYDYSGNLDYFSNYRTVFNGDLGHLINQPSTTSVAYINSLCSTYNYAYSAVSQYFYEVPIYSWSIMASTHEMGHALGSPHTHACAWNGNNTAIDGCGPTATDEANEGCDGPIPNAGTIMSYCHLLPDVGINLASGFGTQPSQLIRNTIDSKSCLGTDCINSCFRSIEDLILTNITTNSATINIQDQISTEWKYKIYTYPGSTFLWNDLSISSFNAENLQPNTYYEVLVTNTCESGTTIGGISRLLLTDGNYCNGDIFTDTGSNTGNYEDNQYIVKTFYPANNNEKIKLDFIELYTEAGYDFMNIYDGTSTDSPIFTNGENLSGDLSSQALSFTATNPEGAITVKFVADEYVTESGWEAEISCLPANLAANNFDIKDITIYPNPTQSNFTINSNQEINKVTVYDISGRKVIERKSINDLNTTINIETLSNGAYFVNINSQNTTQTFKVIKN